MRLFLTLAISALLLSGCGGPSFPTSTVDGKVTVDGKPIAEGTMSITPLTGNRGQGMSTPIREGRYHVEGVPQGKVRVFLTAIKDTGETYEQFGKQVPKFDSLIPREYSSGIEFEVQGEKMEHDFQLTSKVPPTGK